MGLFDRLKGLFGGGGSPPGDEGTTRDPISCEEALEKLFEYLDGELDGPDEPQVARHFAACKRCFPRLRFERAFQEAIRSVRNGEAPPPDLRRRVLEALTEAGLRER